MGPILLEGPDGGGKTTLAKTLAARYDLHIEKNGPPKPGEDLAATYRAQLQPDTVIDRAWPSELAYAKLLGRTPLISNHQSAALFGELAEAKGHIIVCLPPLFECQKVWQGRKGELFQDPSILAEAWGNYLDLVFAFRSHAEFLRQHNRLNPQADEDIFAWLEKK